MDHWQLLAYLGVAVAGVLGFLRVVASEIAVQAEEVEQRIRAEAARRQEPDPQPQPQEIVAAKAA